MMLNGTCLGRIVLARYLQCVTEQSVSAQHTTGAFHELHPQEPT